ncbi:class III extradiol dioxygenase subunit B-like domain-containing protein [Actinopolymorpha alba]|uniref:class III extradiol dioxygenase subunit B-like domain-containing protein n=1 Tax=Actinopolymorpha alba TaxID=533267 RepID=UPI000376E9A2|nr:class III extradiol dioxygenase subunit B-like domain-containing protein [Actinopolymorpha alba]
MFVAAAICPHPPVLVPALASGAAVGLDAVRSACDDAVGRLLAARPDAIVCVGDAPTEATWDGSAVGSFAAYGVDARAGGRHAGTAAGVRNAVDAGAGEAGVRDAGRPVLPLALTMGAWLLDRAGYAGDREYTGVPRSWSPTRCEELGRRLAARPRRMGFLVLGDGSARRSKWAPGDFDPRAQGLDAGLGASLGSGDLDGLRGLQPDRANELLVAGRAAWQVLTGAAAGSTVEAVLLADEAPYGVGYFVASWRARLD